MRLIHEGFQPDQAEICLNKYPKSHLIASGVVIINFPEELRVGETRLASAEDLDSLQSEVEVEKSFQ